MAQSIAAQEKKWQREYDARTLADAETIKSNPARLKGAQTEAKRMAKQAQTEAKSLSKVAGRSSTHKTSSPRPRSGAVVKSNTNIPGVKKRR